MILDSNIVIYSIQPNYANLRNWVFNNNIAISSITLLEVLGYQNLSNADKNDFEELFSYTEVYPVSQEIIKQAIDLRQQQKMSLGDAIIAATALLYKQTLATRNTKDFKWIDGLKMINPFEELHNTQQ
jgi:predicted nucleic acid-binding protein